MFVNLSLITFDHLLSLSLLHVQLREYGRYYKQRDDKYHLQHEVHALREKCRLADGEQARLHSQVKHTIASNSTIHSWQLAHHLLQPITR